MVERAKHQTVFETGEGFRRLAHVEAYLQAMAFGEVPRCPERDSAIEKLNARSVGVRRTSRMRKAI